MTYEKKSIIVDATSVKINLSSKFEKQENETLLAAAALTGSNTKVTTAASTALELNKITENKMTSRSAVGKSTTVGVVSDFTHLAGP